MSMATDCLSLRFDVVAEQDVLIAEVQLAVGDDRVRPGRQAGAVGLFETTPLDVLLRFGSIKSMAPSSMR